MFEAVSQNRNKSTFSVGIAKIAYYVTFTLEGWFDLKFLQCLLRTQNQALQNRNKKVSVILWKCLTKPADSNHNFTPLASLGLSQEQSSLVSPYPPTAKSLAYTLTHSLPVRLTRVFLHCAG